MIVKLCCHCNKRRASRSRGLCWLCYEDPEIRNLYQPISKFGVRGVMDRNGCRPQPLKATNALPGSLEKIAELEQRAKRGESLWHPQDARLRGT